MLVSIFGVALSAAPSVINGYTGYVGALGNAFAPIAGILIVDYVLLRGMQVDVPALFDVHGPYWYWRGFNLLALFWTLVGFVVCTVLIPVSWLPTLLAPIGTGICYYVSMRVLGETRWRLPTDTAQGTSI